MPSTSRTLGPLHLEDLEPHRFEDLTRQLLYDFRRWQSLEATGRSGSDDGFDARGWELVSKEIELSDDDEDTFEGTGPTETRLWLIQCKREKSISPKKLLAYLDQIPIEERKQLYGILFVAACDFSKAARDGFREKCHQFGFSEAYLWGKGEIEDLLFQAKNDHLLFAYFGISLQTRKRSLRTDLRARIAIKRKAAKVLKPHQSFLIRDATDERYPYLDPDKSKTRYDRGRWKVYQFIECAHDGIRVLVGRHFAYLGDDGKEWDFAETHNDARNEFDDPWFEWPEHETAVDEGTRAQLWDLWEKFPEPNKAWFEAIYVLPYDGVLAIDEDGDQGFDKPHVYTNAWSTEAGPFDKGHYEKLSTFGHPVRHRNAETGDRVEKFPRAKK